MQSLQQHRDDGEGRAQESTPSYSQPVYRPLPPPYPYQGQPPVIVQNFYQSPPVASPVMVDVQHSGPGMLSRALWFLFIGWWLGYLWALVGYVLSLPSC